MTQTKTTPRKREAFLQSPEPLAHGDAIELLGRVNAFLPSNYTAVLVPVNTPTFRVKITGQDDHGWTLDGYVIPRLATGNLFASEVVCSLFASEVV